MGSRKACPADVDIEILELGGERLAVITFPAPKALEVALTAVEIELLRCLADGMTNAEIAARRGRAVRTVVNQIAALSKKFGTSSRTELVAKTAHVSRARE